MVWDAKQDLIVLNEFLSVGRIGEDTWMYKTLLLGITFLIASTCARIILQDR